MLRLGFVIAKAILVQSNNSASMFAKGIVSFACSSTGSLIKVSLADAGSFANHSPKPRMPAC
jgi:hypothetical protein